MVHGPQITFLKYVAVAAALMGAPSAATAQSSPPELGTWINHTGRGAVETYLCGTSLCGKIVWLKEPNTAGRPKRDAYNPDPKKRHRPVCGVTTLAGLKRMTSGSWGDGQAYNPEEGKQYNVAVRLADADTLKVTGSVLFFSKTVTWKRAKAPLERCDGVKPPATVAAPAAEAPTAKPVAVAPPATATPPSAPAAAAAAIKPPAPAAAAVPAAAPPAPAPVRVPVPVPAAVNAPTKKPVAPATKAAPPAAATAAAATVPAVPQPKKITATPKPAAPAKAPSAAKSAAATPPVVARPPPPSPNMKYPPGGGPQPPASSATPPTTNLPSVWKNADSTAKPKKSYTDEPMIKIGN